MNDEEKEANQPLNVKEVDQKTCEELLPSYSKEKYKKIYNKFQKWQESKRVPISETLLIEYFTELSESIQCSSLWAIYSMLKSTIRIYNQIDIGTYTELISFLKAKSENHVPKKSNVLSYEDVTRFLTEAPDDHYLAMKVVLIFGIMGGLRVDELVNIVVDNITEHDGIFLVRIPRTKFKKPKSFTIHDEYFNIVKKYQLLRPPKANCTNRFFLTYRNRKCTVQPIGKNKLASMAKDIASYLGLKDPDRFTGHSFRRTSTTLLANPGCNLSSSESHDERLPNKIDVPHTGESVTFKKETVNRISSTANLPSTSSDSSGKQSSSSLVNSSTINSCNKIIPSSKTAKPRKNKNKSKGVVANADAFQKNFQNFKIVVENQGVQIPASDLCDNPNAPPTNYYFSNCTVTIQSPEKQE